MGNLFICKRSYYSGSTFPGVMYAYFNKTTVDIYLSAAGWLSTCNRYEVTYESSKVVSSQYVSAFVTGEREISINWVSRNVFEYCHLYQDGMDVFTTLCQPILRREQRKMATGRSQLAQDTSDVSTK